MNPAACDHIREHTASLSIHRDPPTVAEVHAFEKFVSLTIGYVHRQVAVEWFLRGEECLAVAAILRKAADDLETAHVTMRASDLFLCPTCEEHFVSDEATPICSRCKTYKVLNVPEETVYCGTCNLGADSVDEDGCCSDCAKHFREEAAASRIAHRDYQESIR